MVHNYSGHQHWKFYPIPPLTPIDIKHIKWDSNFEWLGLIPWVELVGCAEAKIIFLQNMAKLH